MIGGIGAALIWPLLAFPATLNCSFDEAGRQHCSDDHAALRSSDSSYPARLPERTARAGTPARRGAAVLVTTTRACYNNARGERECRLLPR